VLEAIAHSAQHLADAIANAGQGIEWYVRAGQGADKAQTHGARTQDNREKNLPKNTSEPDARCAVVDVAQPARE
jgi:hypothetical protein